MKSQLKSKWLIVSFSFSQRRQRGGTCTHHAFRMDRVLICLNLIIPRMTKNLVGIWDHIPSARLSLMPLGLIVSIMDLREIFCAYTLPS